MFLQTKQRLFTRIHEIGIGEVYRLYSEKAVQEGIESPMDGSPMTHLPVISW
jgi:hypothetical protein